MQKVHDLLKEHLGKTYTAVSVEIRQHGATLFRAAYGSLDPDGQSDGPAARTDSYFDFASLTKLFTTTAFFRILDTGKIALDTPVSSILSAFTGPRAIEPYPNPLNIGELIRVVPATNKMLDAGAVTFEHLLTHSSGLPAWLNLRDKESEPERIEMCLSTSFAYPTGSRTLYSDIGYTLLGKAIEHLTDRPLDSAMKVLVTKPLELSTRYGVVPPINTAPTEFCAWRKRRLVGEVHDENSATLGGIAGHAGLFGTATDVATLGQVYLDQGGGFISPRLAANATRPHIEDRGLGWLMYTPEGPGGSFMSSKSYGHTGFVGTSLWIDPESELVCVALSNAVFYGRDRERLFAFRRAFHDCVIGALKGT